MRLIYNQVASAETAQTITFNMSTQNFSDQLSQALQQLSDLSSSDEEHGPSKPSFGQKDQFSDHLQSLLSQLADSPDNDDSQSSSESSEEDLTHPESPGDAPEHTEDEIVPEPPNITYQFSNKEGNQELEPLDPAGEQPLLLNSENSYLI